MIDAITAWVKTIVLVVLFASFMELLLPASSMQRFVRVIMGLLVMLAMLNPVIDLLQPRFLSQQIPAIGARHGGSTDRVKEGTGAVLQERDRLAVQMYKNDLAKQIRAVSIAVDGVAEARVTVELKDSLADNPGAVEKVTVYVLPGKNLADEKVTPVNIGGSEPKPQEISAALKEKMARTIRELYQLRDSQVEIKRLN